MWGFISFKERCLCQAIDHNTDEILDYVLPDRKDTAFLKFKALLRPFGITQS